MSPSLRREGSSPSDESGPELDSGTPPAAPLPPEPAHFPVANSSTGSVISNEYSVKALPENLPLPASNSTSLEAIYARGSLDLEQKSHANLSRDEGLGADASRVPLPESERSFDSFFNDPHVVAQISRHQRYLRQVAKRLPHLTNVLHNPRRAHARIACFDYNNGTFSKTADSGNNNTSTQSTLEERYVQILQNVESWNKLRVLLVEDLSVELMDLMGSQYDINPECFEEHLLNSGWGNDRYDDKEASEWRTASLEKNYASFRWYRPVKIKDRRAGSLAARGNFLREDGRYRWNRPISFSSTRSSPFLTITHGVRHEGRLIRNIFRQSIDLSMNSFGYDPRRDPEFRDREPESHAWEERVSICRKDFGDRSLVIILVDPLPTLEVQLKGSVPTLLKLDFLPSSERRRLNALRTPQRVRDAGMLHRSWTYARPPQNKTRSFKQRFNSFVDGLLETNTVNRNVPGNYTSGVGVFFKNLFIRLASPLLLRRRTTDDESISSVGTVYDETRKTILLHSGPWEMCVFENYRLRSPISYEKDFPITKLAPAVSRGGKPQDFPLATSTFNDFTKWLLSSSLKGMPEERLFCGLLRIISGDIKGTFYLMDKTLTRIGDDMVDDSKLQQELPIWRQAIDKIDLELRNMKRSLIPFSLFVERIVHDINYDYQKVLEVEEATREHKLSLSGAIDELRNQCLSIRTSLMSSLSIVESKRGIAEAESVTKLTELAFLFIPLSFAASFFGMQVEELNPSSTSISAFFGLAIASVALLYGVRLAIRSETLLGYHSRVMNQIRTYGSIPPNRSVPNSLFFRWLLQRFFSVFRRNSIRKLLSWMNTTTSFQIAFLVAIVIALLVPIWLSSLTKGIQVVVTIVVVVLFCSALLGLLFWQIQARFSAQRFSLDSDSEDEEDY